MPLRPLGRPVERCEVESVAIVVMCKIVGISDGKIVECHTGNSGFDPMGLWKLVCAEPVGKRVLLKKTYRAPRDLSDELRKLHNGMLQIVPSLGEVPPLGC